MIWDEGKEEAWRRAGTSEAEINGTQRSPKRQKAVTGGHGFSGYETPSAGRRHHRYGRRRYDRRPGRVRRDRRDRHLRRDHHGRHGRRVRRDQEKEAVIPGAEGRRQQRRCG